VGAVFAVLAGFFAVWQHQSNITVGGELAFAGITAAVLLLVGVVLRTGADPASVRLRSAMWLASTAAFGAFAGLLVNPRIWEIDPAARPLVAEAAVTVYAVVLWWRSHATLQHLAAFLATAVLIATSIGKASPGGEPWRIGLGIWVLSLLWGGAVHRGYLPPRTVGYVMAEIGLLFGAQLTMELAVGPALAVVTVAGLLAAGVALHRLLLVGVGTAGAIVMLPQVMSKYLPPGVGTAAAVFAVGAVMLGVALWLARSR
jgi:hypothetical protein